MQEADQTTMDKGMEDRRRQEDLLPTQLPRKKGHEMIIKTVNVIEYAGDDLVSIRSYSEDEEGNKEAEDTFKSIVKEHDSEVTDEDLDSFTEEGYHEQGDYQLFLSHSS